MTVACAFAVSEALNKQDCLPKPLGRGINALCWWGDFYISTHKIAHYKKSNKNNRTHHLRVILYDVSNFLSIKF